MEGEIGCFKRSVAGFISEFSVSHIGYLAKDLEHSLPYYLHIVWCRG